MITSRWIRLGVAALTAAAFCTTTAQAQVQVDPRLPDYEPVSGVSGTIKSVGSDTMNNLMTLWSEGFKKHYPGVTTEIEGKGSSTAPAALIEGTATFGPMSRAMKAQEIDEFKAKFGYAPVALKTSIDMLAVYVNKDNPIDNMNFAQIDAIFSKTRKQGHEDNIRTWGQLGLEGPWASLPISPYGRNSASGTYGYFKEHVLDDGDYKDEVKEQPGSSAVVSGVAGDRAGIGYSGIGYKTEDVKVVNLAPGNSTDFVDAKAENAYSGAYPLARFLNIAVNYEPESELDPLRREFITFIFSKQGQMVVIQDGYLPVPFEVAKEQMKAMGLELEPAEVPAQDAE